MKRPASHHGIRQRIGFALALLCVAVTSVAIIAPVTCAAETRGNDPVKGNDGTLPRIASDRTGSIPTKSNATLHLTADLGSVRVVALPAGAAPEVRYAVHIETDAGSPLAEHLLDRYALTARGVSDGVEIAGALPAQLSRASSNGAQFWVEFEIAVPRGYSVEVKTEAGDIETQDIGGAAQLVTQGGNIRTGRIGVERPRDASSLVAKLETEGGHIQVADVAGDLNAFTAGGHINAGNIAGDAHLHSGGGHIRAGQIHGRADLETDGGNITIGQAGSFVAVRTGGGQIDFGEVRGSVRAQTGGGGIRIMYVSGPLEVESSAGSICLTRVAGTVRAATAGGTIRAWINPDAPSSPGGTVHLAGFSQLTSGKGDIVVFLPRNLAADIDAVVESGGAHKIDADPALALAVQQTPGARGGPLHAEAKLNGGGPPLKLRTNSGTIRLQFLDSEVALRDSLIRDQRERLTQYGVQLLPAEFDVPEMAQSQSESQPAEDKGDWLESWINRMEIAFWGGSREDPEEFRKHLTSWPTPPYPEVAQRAGVQGMVKLEVRGTKDGRIEVLKLIEGSPTLADAAISTMKLWRVNPSWVSAKKGDVISTVTFNFQLPH